MAEDLLLGGPDRGLFRRDTLERLLREHSERRADHGHRLWCLCALELWQRRWVDSLASFATGGVRGRPRTRPGPFVVRFAVRHEYEPGASARFRSGSVRRELVRSTSWLVGVSVTRRGCPQAITETTARAGLAAEAEGLMTNG